MTSIQVFYLSGAILLLALAIILSPTLVYRRKKRSR